MRSWLTILSILIGIMSIFALLSFGMGIQNYVDELASESGVDKIFIQAKGIGVPGTDENFFITKEDVDFVGKIKGIDEFAGMYFRVVEINHNKQKKFNFLVGYDPDNGEFIEESFGTGVVKGREIKKGDTNKVVLGYNYQFADKIFSKPIRLGDSVELNGESHEVVGFYDEIGNPGDDANVYLTLESFETLIPAVKDKYAMVMIRAQKSENLNQLADKIQEKLRKFKDQEEGKEDFFVQTFEDAIATFTNIIVIINGVLVLIALISMLVASVNIMNTMYTSILERTKEIGIMKAIGARNSDILLIFVLEAGMLGGIGGVLGVIMGYLVSSAGGQAAAASGFGALQPTFPLSLIIGSIMFAFIVGAFSGLLPALRASKMKPVDALRYE